MKKHYIQSVSAIAILLPFLIAIVVSLVIKITSNSILGDFNLSKTTFTNDTAINYRIPPIKKQHVEIAPFIEPWEKITTSESFNSLNSALRKAIETNDSTKTLQILSAQRGSPNRSLTHIKSSSSAFTIEGTYTELQNVMLQTESTLPNLMVQTMSLAPQKAGNLLELKINYTSWETEQ
ncbi:hypothetical protein [Rubritalea marina]|uniref:hypothetical protein n=1 Tax=Rubritalea marina TaxID=361055 RepID=UPI00035CA36C|nr:hypothetical protein [Rubritalea marina]